jgi:hypothetical protein
MGSWLRLAARRRRGKVGGAWVNTAVPASQLPTTLNRLQLILIQLLLAPHHPMPCTPCTATAPAAVASTGRLWPAAVVTKLHAQLHATCLSRCCAPRMPAAASDACCATHDRAAASAVAAAVQVVRHTTSATAAAQPQLLPLDPALSFADASRHPGCTAPCCCSGGCCCCCAGGCCNPWKAAPQSPCPAAWPPNGTSTLPVPGQVHAVGEGVHIGPLHANIINANLGVWHTTAVA